MKKADQSGKVGKPKQGKNKKKEEAVVLTWPLRETFLLKYLTAIADAKAQEIDDNTGFSDNLKSRLLGDADLASLIRSNPYMAKRVIGCLPCGQNVVKAYLLEVICDKDASKEGEDDYKG